MPLRRSLAIAPIVAIVLAAAPSSLAAQGGADSTVAPAPTTAARRQSDPMTRPLLIAINPIWAIFGAYSLNVERALDGSSSVGLEASYFDGDLADGDDEDGGDTWADTYVRSSLGLHYRYYPRAVFQGLSLDASAGWARVEDEDLCLFVPDEACGQREHASTVHFGFELGWNWLPGDADRLQISLALGARRHLITGDARIDGEKAFVTPAGRFSVGLRF